MDAHAVLPYARSRMDLLPGDHERRALLDGLAALIASQGFKTFVAAPIVGPHPRFFPEPWEPSVRGVRALALRPRPWPSPSPRR